MPPRFPSWTTQEAQSQHLPRGSELLGRGQGSGETLPQTSTVPHAHTGHHVLTHPESTGCYSCSKSPPVGVTGNTGQQFAAAYSPPTPLPSLPGGAVATVKGERHSREKEALARKCREQRGSLDVPSPEATVHSCRPGPLLLASLCSRLSSPPLAPCSCLGMVNRTARTAAGNYSPSNGPVKKRSTGKNESSNSDADK